MIERILTVGQHLGLANNIAEMWHIKSGKWRIKDAWGEIYTQEKFPQGLRTSTVPESCVDLPYTPWPPKET